MPLKGVARMQDMSPRDRRVWDQFVRAVNLSWLDGTSLEVADDGTLTVRPAGVNHDDLNGYEANEHIDHSGVTITGGGAISGGGDLTANRVLSLALGAGVKLDGSSQLTTELRGTVVVTGNYTIQDGDETIYVDPPAGTSVTITLPDAASNPRRRLYIKRNVETTPVSTVTIQRQGTDAIDNLASIALYLDHDAVELHSGPAGWNIASTYIQSAFGHLTASSAGAFTISAAGSWTEVDSGFTVRETSLMGSGGSHHLIAYRPGRYVAQVSAALNVGAANKELGLTVMINGSAFSAGFARTYAAASGENYHLSSPFILDLSASDQVSVGVTNFTDTTSVSVDEASLVVYNSHTF